MPLCPIPPLRSFLWCSSVLQSFWLLVLKWEISCENAAFFFKISWVSFVPVGKLRLTRFFYIKLQMNPKKSSKEAKSILHIGRQNTIFIGQSFDRYADFNWHFLWLNAYFTFSNAAMLTEIVTTFAPSRGASSVCLTVRQCELLRRFFTTGGREIGLE